MRLGSVLGALGAAGVAIGVAYAGWTHYSPIQAGENMVRERLRDPASAQFRNVKHNKATGAVCGEVNAKNSMGGYVGFEGFIAESDGRVTFAPKPNDEADGTPEKVAALQDRIRFLEWAQRFCVDEKQP